MTRVVNIAQSGGNNVTMRNRIINGAMMIDQRGSASTPVANTAGANNYFLDRWHIFGGQASKMTAQQSSTVPASATFTKSALITSSAATSAGAGDAYGVRQIIEGNNVADLGFGTANAQSITLSFWVRSSITGTYSFACWNSANNPVYIATYVINQANTWEQKTITISGSTTGTWLTDNGIGLQCWWDLGSGSNFNGTAGIWNTGLLVRTSGSVNWVGTNGATFYITGVQLEAGTTATPFEQRLYGTELALCQRYFQTYINPPLRGFANGGSSIFRMGMVLPVVMRASPSATAGALTGYEGTNTTTVTGISTSYATSTLLEFDFSTSSALTAGRPAAIIQSGSAVLTLSAEL